MQLGVHPSVVHESYYLTRAEALVYFNRRGWRPGLVGIVIDGADGVELDRMAAVFSMQRERAEWQGFKLPWGQSDEKLRSRIWLKFQDESHARRRIL